MADSGGEFRLDVGVFEVGEVLGQADEDDGATVRIRGGQRRGKL